MEACFVSYGRIFDTLAFRSEREANAFMLANVGWAVIGEVGNVVHLAKMDDKGSPVK